MEATDLKKLTYVQLKKLAEDATAQLESKRDEELKVLADGYAKKLEQAGFTINEGVAALGPYKPAKTARKARVARADKGVAAEPKYKGPNGELWSGRGQAPKWMKPLIAAGKKKADFLITEA